MSVFRQSAFRQKRLGGIKAGPPARPGPRCHGNDPKQCPGVRHRSDSSDDLLTCWSAGSTVCMPVSILLSARCCQVQVWSYWSCLSHRLSVQCSVLPGTGVELLELSVSSSVCSVLGAARYRCGATGVVCLIVCLFSARCCQVQVWRYWSCLSPICHDSVSDSWALVLLTITRGYSELELKIPRCWRFCFTGCSERSRCIWSNYFQF